MSLRSISRSGLAEGDAYDESLPSFYVIPMKGQMGTDIRLDAYEPIISEIRAEQPDVVIWLMEWHAAASYPHDA